MVKVMASDPEGVHSSRFDIQLFFLSVADTRCGLGTSFRTRVGVKGRQRGGREEHCLQKSWVCARVDTLLYEGTFDTYPNNMHHVQAFVLGKGVMSYPVAFIL